MIIFIIIIINQSFKPSFQKDTYLFWLELPI